MRREPRSSLQHDQRPERNPLAARLAMLSINRDDKRCIGLVSSVKFPSPKRAREVPRDSAAVDNASDLTAEVLIHHGPPARHRICRRRRQSDTERWATQSNPFARRAGP
jgi:hypothetical protein